MFKTARLLLKFNQSLEAWGVGILALDGTTKAKICLAAVDQERINKRTDKQLRKMMDPANRHLAPSGYASSEDYLNIASEMAAYAVLGPKRLQEKTPPDPFDYYIDFAKDRFSRCKEIVDRCVANSYTDLESKAFRLIVGNRVTLDPEFYDILAETMKRYGLTSL